MGRLALATSVLAMAAVSCQLSAVSYQRAYGDNGSQVAGHKSQDLNRIQLPLSFVPNEGQTDRRVRFIVHGPGYIGFLTGDALVLAVAAPAKLRGNVTPAGMLRALGSAQVTERVVRLRYVGASAGSRIEGQALLPGRSSYFLGNDPRHWRAGLPAFQAVLYRDVYSGIDLRVYTGHAGSAAALEMDWVVRPGADPARIRLALSGPARPRIDGHGNITLLPSGVFTRPVAYQQIGSRRRLVPARYRLGPGGAIGVTLRGYDHRRPLVIDPALAYSVAFGGSLGAQALGIAVDGKGDAYVVGSTLSSNFPKVDAAQATLAGQDDALVAKLDPAGNALLYSTYLGGSASDTGISIALDSSGAAYITGETLSEDFPTLHAIQSHNTSVCLVHNGQTIPCNHAFVAKLDPAGSRLVYSTYLGGESQDEGYSIAVNSSGEAYVTGQTTSDTFPVMNALQPGRGGDICYGQGGVQSPCSDAFVSKLTPAGSALVYSTYLGGSGNNLGYGIAVDRNGDAYVTGITNSTDFPLVHPLLRAPGDQGNAFLSELNPAGSALVYSTLLGKSGDTAMKVAIRKGSAYVAGYTYNATAALVTQVAPKGARVVYRRALGGNRTVAAGGVAVDSAGNVFVAGDVLATNLHTVAPIQAANAGKHDVFVAELNPTGKRWLLVTYLGGSSDDFGENIAVGPQGNAYVAGQTFSSNFPDTVSVAGTTGVGLFVARIGG